MKLKIVSWNIWCDGDFNGISKFLKSSNADIIGLQEVLPNSKKIPVIDFLKSLGYEYIYDGLTITFSDGNTKEMGNAVFSKYKIIGTKVHNLSKENNRIAVQADIELPNGILHVFSTHIIHSHLMKPSELQDIQAENLLKILPKEKVIVTGDFNATPESNAVKIITKTLSNTDENLAPTWSIHPEGCPVCKPQKLDLRLDYIFASNDLKTSSAKVESSKASDHLPISVLAEV